MRRYIVVILFLISCSKEQSDVMLYDGDIAFYMDSISSLTPRYLSVSNTDGRECLSVLDRLERKCYITFYDISTGDTVRRVPLDVDGPNGVGRPFGHYVISKDSIVIISPHHYTISLVDHYGSVLKRYKIFSDLSKKDAISSILRIPIFSGFHYVNGILYFTSTPDAHPYDVKTYDGYMSARLDLTTGEFNYIKSFPKRMQGHAWGNFGRPYQTITEDSLILYSYAMGNHIEIYDFKKNMISNKEIAHSEFYDKEAIPHDVSECDDGCMLSRFLYQDFLYDRYRNIYYRFLQHPMSDQEYNAYQKQSPMAPLFHRFDGSILVFNENLEKIGEFMIPKKIYSSYYYFIAKDGLYLAMHPDNPNLQEDAL